MSSDASGRVSTGSCGAWTPDPTPYLPTWGFKDTRPPLFQGGRLAVPRDLCSEGC